MFDIVPGDSRDVMASWPADSVDAIVTDPPYGLRPNLSSALIAEVLRHWLADDRNFVPDGHGFVGQPWDSFVPPPALWGEALRVLKPGGFAFVFASPKTVDLMGLSCRLAGFDVLDSIAAIQGQRMPKSSNVAASLRKAGLDADAWQGWGTALKVANDPILVLRKPPRLPTYRNVAAWGVGALHVDACRTELADPAPGEQGRFPADVVFCHHPDCAASCHPDCPVGELDRQSGTLTSGANPSRKSGGHSVAMAGALAGMENAPVYRGVETGGASRFFPAFRYAPIAQASERPSADGTEHVSVKPLALMRWLCRLVGTSDRGDGRPSLICDPFAGSGTTGEAAVLEGFDAVCIEQNPAYLPLIEQRRARSGHSLEQGQNLGRANPVGAGSSDPVGPQPAGGNLAL